MPNDRPPAARTRVSPPRAARLRLAAASIAALAPLAALSGCGGVHGIPVDSTSTQIAQTVCPKAYECCTQSQLMGNSSAGTDEASCESMTKSDFAGNLEAVQASQDQGRATFDNAKLQACLNTIRSASCDTLDMTNHLMGIPGCDSFVDPLVAIGGACSNDYECVDGWCQQPTDMSGGDGACQPHAQLGQSCLTATCEAGLTCDVAATDETCVQPGALGAACTDPLQCASVNCSMTDATTPGTCVAATGTQCFYASGCSAAGSGRPNTGTTLLLAAVALIAALRARRFRAR